MNIYKEQLIKEGIKETNAERLAIALDTLHASISRMDRQQLTLFAKEGLNTHLKRFAILEDLAMFDLDKLIVK